MTLIEVGQKTPFETMPDVPRTVVDADSIAEVTSRFGDYWQPDYSLYKHPEVGLPIMRQKITDVARMIQEEGDLTQERVEADMEVSLATADRFYDEWTSTERVGGGSFAFMVPTRAERKNGFAPEFKPFYPIIDHVGPRIGQLMLVGTPPFIVDRYQRGQNGSDEQGAMLFAPVFGDMLDDITDSQQLSQTFNRAVEDAVSFVHERLGVSSVGLGAILPAVTNFGRSINVEGVQTTTGHGGTIHLIKETINKAISEGVVEEDLSHIGVVGLGSIGASIVSVMVDEYPDANLLLCDSETRKIDRTVRTLGLSEKQYKAMDSAAELLAMEECKVIVCAITEPIEINRRIIHNAHGQIDRLIIDDSQPTAVNPIDAKNNAGAHVVWPIGESVDSRLHRTDFDYDSLGPIGNGVWGCEAEAFLAWQDPELALRRPVTPETTREIGLAATKSGIGAAQLQCYGQYAEV